VTCSRFY